MRRVSAIPGGLLPVARLRYKGSLSNLASELGVDDQPACEAVVTVALLPTTSSLPFASEDETCAVPK